MSIKSILVSIIVIGVASAASAQKKIDFSVRLSANVNVAGVKDPYPAPSSINFPSDGYTVKEADKSGMGIGVNVDLPLSESVIFHPGLWFTSKNLLIRNTDGNYSGVSEYSTMYLQVPLLLKIYTKEVADNFRLFFTPGITLDIKAKEALKGGDGAHYWNLAKNYYWADGSRGRNGNNRPMDLFSPADIGLYLGMGGEFAIADDFNLFFGLSLNKGMINMINKDLLFRDPYRVQVSSGVSIISNLVAVDMGVKF